MVGRHPESTRKCLARRDAAQQDGGWFVGSSGLLSLFWCRMDAFFTPLIVGFLEENKPVKGWWEKEDGRRNVGVGGQDRTVP